jgi:hypothetical protein
MSASVALPAALLKGGLRNPKTSQEVPIDGVEDVPTQLPDAPVVEISDGATGSADENLDPSTSSSQRQEHFSLALDEAVLQPWQLSSTKRVLIAAASMLSNFVGVST